MWFHPFNTCRRQRFFSTLQAGEMALTSHAFWTIAAEVQKVRVQQQEQTRVSHNFTPWQLYAVPKYKMPAWCPACPKSSQVGDRQQRRWSGTDTSTPCVKSLSILCSDSLCCSDFVAIAAGVELTQVCQHVQQLHCSADMTSENIKRGGPSSLTPECVTTGHL